MRLSTLTWAKGSVLQEASFNIYYGFLKKFLSNDRDALRQSRRGLGKEGMVSRDTCVTGRGLQERGFVHTHLMKAPVTPWNHSKYIRSSSVLLPCDLSGNSWER